MQYGYRYHDSEGRVKCGEIGAPTREDAFVALKSQGIKPMQFWTIEATADTGFRFGKRWFAIFVLAALTVGLAAYVVLSRRTDAPVERERIVRPITSEAVGIILPRSRHQLKLAGRLSDLAASFDHPAERVLVAFAEPGCEVVGLAPQDVNAFAGDLADALESQTFLREKDSKDLVEVKRVLAGMKEEVAMRLAGGASASDILAWLESRQRLESDHFEDVRRRVREGRMDIDLANRNLRTMGLPELSEKDVTRSGEISEFPPLTSDEEK